MNRDLLDPGVRAAVIFLRASGFRTTDSGDGVTKANLIASGDALPLPHVFMRVPTHALLSEADRLRELLFSHRHSLTNPGSNHPMGPFRNYRIEATYNPVDGIGTLALFGDPDDEPL